MTNPVILLGTQSNGETLPVQVDAFGRLVAEGLQGSEGPQGPQGPEGPAGPPGISLPPDPYEGALLGWLNNELAWVGTPPVPIPPGVFGPITSWNAQSGLLAVEGSIPDTVGNGVYIYQCDVEGVYFTEGWDTRYQWSNQMTGYRGNNPERAFDGLTSTLVEGNGGSTPYADLVVDFSYMGGVDFSSSLEIYSGDGLVYSQGAYINSEPVNYNIRPNTWTTLKSGGGKMSRLTITKGDAGSLTAFLAAVRVDGKMLVDTGESLNLRVNQVIDNNIIGVPSAPVDFTAGKYLYISPQKVAPWVLYGNDPTSLIDHLRSS